MNCLTKILLAFLILLFIGCSNKKPDQELKFEDTTPELMYSEALENFSNKNYDFALNKFQEIESRFPLSKESIQSQIMAAFIYYLRLDYDSAILKFDKIILKYPSYKEIDYVYYMRAMCFYEQIDNPELDGSINDLALKNFLETINRFPDSKYARDSQQKIILINENIAAKHMSVGMFYLKEKKYLAAMKRYQKVVDNHSKSKFVPEALHRLVEIYYTIGMVADAEKTTAVIGYNYPNSKWYEYSYKITGKNEKENEKNNSFFKKIFNKFTNDDEKN